MMSYVRTIRLYCDDCGCMIEYVFCEGELFVQSTLLQQARAAGWEVDAGHLCSECSSQGIDK